MTTLADELIDVADEIRGSVHEALGTRPYRVFLVRRTWSGGRRGAGEFVETETEILPPPMVRRAITDKLRPAGPEEEGDVVLTEISLSYSESDLYPSELGDAEEFVYRVDDSREDARSRYFVAKSPPRARRGDGARDQIDWRIELRQVRDLR